MPEDPGRTPGDEAVSAVLGVILLVAITVVLAAGVFFLAAQLNQPKNEPPSIGLLAKGHDVRVAQAGPDLDWFEDFVVMGSCAPLLNGGPFPTAAGTPVMAGDVLTCASGEELRISSSEEHGHDLLYEKSFL